MEELPSQQKEGDHGLLHGALVVSPPECALTTSPPIT